MEPSPDAAVGRGDRRLPARADVVVVGSGALGLSTAWHLARLGAGTVVVLEQFTAGSQSSGRAAGLFKQVHADETRTRLACLSIDLATRFEQLTGVPMPLTRSGSVLLARDGDRAAGAREQVRQARTWGVEVEEVSPAALPLLAPWLTVGDARVAFVTPGDIYVEEPATMLRALVNAGERAGVRIIERCAVEGIRVGRGEVVGVSTSLGSVEASRVVDAAGAWAAAVAAPWPAPVVPVRHQLAVTGPVDGIRPEDPVVRFVDEAVYARPCRGGLLFGGFEPRPLAVDPDLQIPSFGMADVPPGGAALRAFGGVIEGYVPVARGAGVAERRAGLLTMTPDGQLAVGRVPGIPGLWLASGCNGNGFSLALGVGQALAEQILHGEGSMDIGALRPDRFAPGVLGREAAREAIGRYTQHYGRHAT